MSVKMTLSHVWLRGQPDQVRCVKSGRLWASEVEGFGVCTHACKHVIHMYACMHVFIGCIFVVDVVSCLFSFVFLCRHFSQVDTRTCTVSDKFHIHAHCRTTARTWALSHSYMRDA